jgi:hypothetical protein
MSSCCFHWDVTPVSESLLGRRVQFLENLLCFKRANPGDCVEHPFWNRPRNNLTLQRACGLGCFAQGRFEIADALIDTIYWRLGMA